MRFVLVMLAALFAMSCASSPERLVPKGERSTIERGELNLTLQASSEELYWTGEPVKYQVEGIASAIGGVRHIDIMMVLDRSMSLKRTDPDDYRSAAAAVFVEHLSPKSDALIGVVGFDDDSELLQPLTNDRTAVVGAIKGMHRSGGTNLAAGIESAVAELDARGRTGSSRLVLLFTDGKSNQRRAREATQNAVERGVTVHTMLLGDNANGGEILEEIALATGGSFVQITDPAKLPEAFLNLRTTGVDRVTVAANGQAAADAALTGGTFMSEVTLDVGENRIVTRAIGLDGQTKDVEKLVNVRDASCASLDVQATYEGLPAISLSERAVEIVMDASRSMWARMDDQPKMEVAKNILLETTEWMPRDLDLAVRAYGNEQPSEASDCADTSLLVPFGLDDRLPVAEAIRALKPNGQTPIAFALQQAAGDFANVEGERTVVLVTDGIESCGGDPASAAAELNELGITIHVIGFGFDNNVDEDAQSLAAIAENGGGRFITASSAAELKQALETTVGTHYRVTQDGQVVAESVLGARESLYLPGGSYRLEFASVPPVSVPVSLAARDALTFTLAKRAGEVSHAEQRSKLAPSSCEKSLAWAQRRGLKHAGVSAVPPYAHPGDDTRSPSR